MKRYICKFLYFLLFPLLFISCQKDDFEREEDDSYSINDEYVKHTVLIYAVNNSTLSFDFNEDLKEMISAASNVDLSKYRILLFKTDNNEKCGLYSSSKDPKSGETFFRLLKEYPRDITSTSPERIKEVIDYAIGLYPNSTYDLVFWGHGMSWKPYFTDHNVIELPSESAYGGEFNSYAGAGDKQTDWTEIDELADCVPDNFFNTIWFDCCYMSGIEVIYEFKNKCETFVGYPSEVYSEGLSYDRVLPLLLSEDHDVLSAARAFYNFYFHNNNPVTVAVIDMSKIEEVADLANEIVATGNERPYVGKLVNYSRSMSSPFYDFGQLFKEISMLNGNPELAERFLESLENLIIYHAESNIDFNFRFWDVDNISGISSHLYRDISSSDENYYRTLSWFKRVYER